MARFGCPDAAQSPTMSAVLVRSSVRWCTAYALSQKIRKSGAAGLERGELGRHGLADHGAGRVAVGGDEPHALDGRVGGQLADGRHVGAVVVQLDRHHLDAVLLGEGEVAVVAGHGADERDLVLLDPRARRVGRAPEQGEHQRVVHHREARVVAGDDLVDRHLHDLGEDRPQLGQSVQPAVVAGVGALRVLVVVAGQRQELEREVELLRRRLAAGEVELQPGVLEGAIRVELLVVEGLDLVGGEGCERHDPNLSRVEVTHPDRGPGAPQRASQRSSLDSTGTSSSTSPRICSSRALSRRCPASRDERVERALLEQVDERARPAGGRREHHRGAEQAAAERRRRPARSWPRAGR